MDAIKRFFLKTSFLFCPYAIPRSFPMCMEEQNYKEKKKKDKTIRNILSKSIQNCRVHALLTELIGAVSIL